MLEAKLSAAEADAARGGFLALCAAELGRASDALAAAPRQLRKASPSCAPEAPPDDGGTKAAAESAAGVSVRAVVARVDSLVRLAVEACTAATLRAQASERLGAQRALELSGCRRRLDACERAMRDAATRLAMDPLDLDPLARWRLKGPAAGSAAGARRGAPLPTEAAAARAVAEARAAVAAAAAAAARAADPTAEAGPDSPPEAGPQESESKAAALATSAWASCGAAEDAVASLRRSVDALCHLTAEADRRCRALKGKCDAVRAQHSKAGQRAQEDGGPCGPSPPMYRKTG